MEQVRSHFRQLEKCLRLTLDDIFIWTPKTEDIERVKFCLSNAAREDVQASLLESMDERLVEITSAEETSVAKGPD